MFLFFCTQASAIIAGNPNKWKNREMPQLSYNYVKFQAAKHGASSVSPKAAEPV